jgi:hypothetical protein
MICENASFVNGLNRLNPIGLVWMDDDSYFNAEISARIGGNRRFEA